LNRSSSEKSTPSSAPRITPIREKAGTINVSIFRGSFPGTLLLPNIKTAAMQPNAPPTTANVSTLLNIEGCYGGVRDLTCVLNQSVASLCLTPIGLHQKPKILHALQSITQQRDHELSSQRP
jgi:hypothetical protein